MPCKNTNKNDYLKIHNKINELPDETDRTQKVTSVEIIKENNNDSLFTLKKDSNRANLINPDLNTKKLQIK